MEGINEWTFCSPVGLSQSASLLGRSLLVFHIRNLSAPSALLTPVPPSLPPPCRPTSPAHPAAALAVERLSPPVRYYSVVRLLARHRLPLRRQTYRSAYLGASRGPCEASWGHVWFFRTVPSAHTLMRWVDGNAFAPIVRARPCPIFGRPVHHGIAPSITARYCSSYPSDSTSRWTPCPPPGCVATSGLRRQDGPPLASTVPGPPSCPATIRSNGASSNPPSSSSAFGGTCGMP